MKKVFDVDRILCFFINLRSAWLKRSMSSFFFHLLSYGSRLRVLFFSLSLSVFLVCGPEKQTGQTINIVFVGGRKLPVFLSNLLFREKPTIHHQGKLFIWRIKTLKNVYDDVDAIFVSCDQFYRRFLHQDGFFVFPHMTNMVLDTSKSLQELVAGLSHSAQEDVKKILKKQFSFQIKSDMQTLKRFYDEMYLPTLKKRIGETDVFTPSLDFLRYLRELGYVLMMITSLGEEVCGVFFKKQGDALILKYAGVLQGDLDLIKKGAFSAFYYYFMVYATEQKVNKLDFGGARPLFNDGLFQNKRKWGMTISPYDFVKEIFGLRIIRESEPLKQFLIHNPFIGMNEKNELIGIVFVDTDMSISEKKEYEKRFCIPGIKEFRFIVL